MLIRVPQGVIYGYVQHHHRDHNAPFDAHGIGNRMTLLGVSIMSYMAMKKPHHAVSTREERTYVDRLEYCSISCIHIQWKWNTVNKFNNAYLEVGTKDSSFFVGNCTGEWGC
jgi:hypothetical protein